MQIEAALERIKGVVGPRGWIADPGECEPYLVEARRLWRGATRLVVRPAATADVAAVVRICAEARLPIVPQGGNTGLVGGVGKSLTVAAVMMPSVPSPPMKSCFRS